MLKDVNFALLLFDKLSHLPTEIVSLTHSVPLLQKRLYKKSTLLSLSQPYYEVEFDFYTVIFSHFLNSNSFNSKLKFHFNIIQEQCGTVPWSRVRAFLKKVLRKALTWYLYRYLFRMSYKMFENVLRMF